MKVSIIVVAHKRYNQLKCLMYSLLSQTYKNFEIIVIHDGIDKNHLKMMDEFMDDDRVIYVQTPIRYNDWGMSLRNIGLKMAKGDIIINTNDDNYYVPIWLSEIVDSFERNPYANFAYYLMVHNYDMLSNHNQSSYGLFTPEIKKYSIDIGQFAVKKDLINGHSFKVDVVEADGDLVEELLPKIIPVFINKILFVHN
jgi:glycosyltransferase involved in cell wall biosynthesis